jgi:hypothetical protein
VTETLEFLATRLYLYGLYRLQCPKRSRNLHHLATNRFSEFQRGPASECRLSSASRGLISYAAMIQRPPAVMLLRTCVARLFRYAVSGQCGELGRSFLFPLTANSSLTSLKPGITKTLQRRGQLSNMCRLGFRHYANTKSPAAVDSLTFSGRSTRICAPKGKVKVTEVHIFVH